MVASQKLEFCDKKELMRDNNHYNGGLTREQFLFFELRTVASLLCDGKSGEDVFSEIREHNLFQFPTERMVRSITNTCLKRIDALESDALIHQIAHAPTEVAKQINLYAIMRQNTIVWDFMVNVIGEKFRTQQFDFSQKDLNLFFLELQERVPEAVAWSDATIKKIQQVLKKFLIECDYLDNARSQELHPVYLFPELEDGIRENNDSQALSAFNCFM